MFEVLCGPKLFFPTPVTYVIAKITTKIDSTNSKIFFLIIFFLTHKISTKTVSATSKILKIMYLKLSAENTGFS